MAAATVEPHEDPTSLPKLSLGRPNSCQNNFGADNSSNNNGTSTLSHPQGKLIENIPEEECWLFKPPQTSEPKNFPYSSCLLWAREVFDSPSSEFYRRRRDLLNRLEIILAREPAKRLPNLGGSVPSLNTSPSAMVAPTPLAKSHGIGGGSGQNFGPGSSATFVRPKRHASEMLSQHSRQRSSPVGNRSPVPFKNTGSTDDLQNVADLQSMARKQEDELKAEVAAISAHHQASRMGGSQQSLNSANRSDQESPYTSQSRLNISSSPTPSDVVKQPMAALRHSLDSQRYGSAVHHGEGSDENLVGGGEVSITLPGLRNHLEEAQSPSVESFPPPGVQQAVIVGRPMGKMTSRLPAPMRRGPRFPSTEALPSFGWSDGIHPSGPMRRSSQEHLAGRRIPMPPPRSGSSLSGAAFQQQ